MKNVVLLTIDCLRYDRCGFNGYRRNTTPVLDELATEGLVYDQCYATGPYTTESFPGILAGQHSYNGFQYGDRTAYKALPTDGPTLATAFADAGYRTSATISNPHLTANRNFDRGFDEFTNFRAPDDDGQDGDDDEDGSRFGDVMYTLREKMRDSRTRYNPLAAMSAAYRLSQLYTDWPTTDAAKLTDTAIESLETNEEPFFHWTHYMDVHAPIHPQRVDQTELGPVPTLRSLFWDASRAGQFDEPRYDKLYDGAVRYVDDQIGRIVSSLKDRGVWEETVLVVTADHGEALYDRQGVTTHPAHYHYDELLHVPLLVANGGVTGRTSGKMSLAWLNELLATVAGVSLPDFPADSGTDDITTGGENLVVTDTLRGAGHTVSVRDGEYKTVAHASDDGTAWEFGETPLTFRYDRDPGERVEIATDRLVDDAESFLASEFELPKVGEGFTEATEQRLQDLGYKM